MGPLCLALALVAAARADEPAPADEPPAVPAPVAIPSDVAPSLTFGMRDQLEALQDARYARARRSTSVLLVASGLEAGAGLLVAATARDSDVKLAVGGTLLVGGAAIGTSAYYQVDLAQRRHAAFSARMTDLVDQPRAWPDLAESARLSAEREARGHAYAAGVYTGVLAAGLVTFLGAGSDQDVTQEAGVALTLLGTTGFIHHVARWRAATRLSTDLVAVDAGIPTVVPDPGP